MSPSAVYAVVLIGTVASTAIGYALGLSVGYGRGWHDATARAASSLKDALGGSK